MATKKYSSSCVKFTVNIKKDGKQTPIVFDRYDPERKRRYIEISDKDIQEQMEKSPDYKVYFSLDQITLDESEKELAAVEATINRLSFSTVKAAKEWLNNDHSIPYHRLMNKEAILKEALKLGFTLSIEQKQ